MYVGFQGEFASNCRLHWYINSATACDIYSDLPLVDHADIQVKIIHNYTSSNCYQRASASNIKISRKPVIKSVLHTNVVSYWLQMYTEFLICPLHLDRLTDSSSSSGKAKWIVWRRVRSSSHMEAWKLSVSPPWPAKVQRSWVGQGHRYVILGL